MISKSIAPSPQTYSAPTTRIQTAFTFGVSRDKFDKVYLRENPPRDKNVPGPASYQYKHNFIEKAAASYSMRPNTNYASMFNDPTKNFPGPGQYNGEAASENKNGLYAHAKYRSPGRAIISKQGQRFDNSDIRRSMELPGPGQYDTKTRIVQKHLGVTVFGRSKRAELVETHILKTPGPGQYRTQSDFGFYDPDDILGSNKSLNRSQRDSFGRMGSEK